MIEALATLPTHLRRRLADALDRGILAEPYGAIGVRAVLDAVEGPERIVAALRELAELGVRGRACAAWLRILDRASIPKAPPELVWSGPEVVGLHTRDTRQVFDEMIDSARRRPSIYLGQVIFGVAEIGGKEAEAY